MEPLASSAALCIVVFAATNVDDLFILAAFFADAALSRGSIVLGQFLGIGMLVLASAGAALVTFVVPDGWPALLGLVPLLLGIRKLLALRQSSVHDAGDAQMQQIRQEERKAERRMHSQALAVAGVTMANGGDNLGVYIPMFASGPHIIPTYALIFTIMTAIWCALGFLLVNIPHIGGAIRRYGHVALPLVLIALGLHILSGASVLFQRASASGA